MTTKATTRHDAHDNIYRARLGNTNDNAEGEPPMTPAQTRL